jgi:signal peptidase
MTPRAAMAGFVRVTRRSVELGLFGLVLIAVFTMLFTRLAGLTGRTALIVAGPSMEPAIGRGAAIIVEPVAADSLAVGDVVSIRVGPEQAIFTHRIVRVVDRPDGLWIETRGDANAAPDPSIIPVSAVIGRVVLSVPSLGYAIVALSTAAGFGLVAGLAGLLLGLIWAIESLENPRPRPATPPAARRPTFGSA